MNQFLGALGRKSSVVNLDAANDRLSYPCALDIFHLISLEDIMRHEGLGPNGGIMYALETLEANFEWLQDGLSGLGGDPLSPALADRR
jgi:GPN-loop GTPase